RLVIRVSQPGGRYEVSAFAQPLACSGRRTIIRSSSSNTDHGEFVLAANRLQTISFLHVRPDQKACEMVFSFEPRTDNVYLLRNFAGAEGCRVELFNVT